MYKLVFLINNKRKKIMLLFVLFFAILAQRDLGLLLLYIPEFNELEVTEGKIKILKGQGRVRDTFTIINDSQKILFSCGISECLPVSKALDYQGKAAKVWGYRSKKIGLTGGENLLYQLEVDKKIVLSYQDQTKRYLFSKEFSPYIYLVFFIVSIILFFLLQFANDPIYPERNEK